jgi:hypothetical protein
MARTITEIYDALISEKENLDALSGLVPAPDNHQTFLQDLTSTSKVAIWRLFLWIVAVAIWAHETLFDRYEAKIIDLKYKLITHTPLWWQQRALEFQFGYTLTWNGAQFVYTTIDEVAKIVKRSAVVVSQGVVRIKVAKLDGGGLPVPLSGPELTAFTAFANEQAPAGINVIVISADADLLKLGYLVYYDPLVLAPDGSLLTSPAVFPVEDAINGYIQNLPFNGVLNLTALTDAIQQALGVVDPVIQSAQAKYGLTAYVDVVDNYTSYAGHMKVDPSFPLSGSITYQIAP